MKQLPADIFYICPRALLRCSRPGSGLSGLPRDSWLAF